MTDSSVDSAREREIERDRRRLSGKGAGGAVDLALALCCVRGQLNGSQLASQTIRKAPLSPSYSTLSPSPRCLLQQTDWNIYK